ALIMTGAQMTFRDYRCIGAGNITQYNIQSSSPLQIWNISNPFSIAAQTPIASSSNTYSFSIKTDSLQQFIAFDGSQYKVPSVIGSIPNQNLHSLQDIQFIIVAPKDFHHAAQTVGDQHANSNYENLNYKIVSPDEIYNEFSSGGQDITAIRQF